MPLRLTLVLVLATRLMLLLLFKPGGGLLDSLGDFGFYRELAELSLDGRRPFIDYWVEYPPLFPWALDALYRLSLRLPGWPSATLPFQATLGGFLLLCDLANVILVRRIAARLSGPTLGDRAALLYALQPFAFLLGLTWFDAFPLVFLLLAVDAALAGRAWLAGLALGLGALAKLIPLVAVPAVLRGLATPRRVLAAALAGAAVAGVGVAPIWVSGSPYAAASLRATLLNRSSWETVWALAEGYWRVGTVAPPRERTLVEAADRVLHPAMLPWTLITGLQVLLFAALCLAPAGPRRPRATVALAGLGLSVFLLLSRGYSPQFLIYELPLLLVLWPDRRGISYTLTLTVLGLLEWPVVLSLFPDRHDMIALVVGARTALWLLIALELAAEVWPTFERGWLGIRRPAGWAAVALGGIGAVALVAVAGAHLPDRGEQAPVLAYVHGLGADGDGPVFASSRTAFYRLAPSLGEPRTVLAVDGVDPSADARVARLRQRIRDSGYWLVLDHSEGDDAWRDRLERELGALGSRTTDRWFAYYHLLGFVRPEHWRDDSRVHPIEASFGGQIALTGWLPTADALRPDEPFRLVLAWRVLVRPARDYKLFVHLLDNTNERILTQEDRPIESGGHLATGWAPGETPITGVDLLPPPGSGPAPARLRLGIYDPTTGARLPVGVSDHVDLPAVFGWRADTVSSPSGAPP